MEWSQRGPLTEQGETKTQMESSSSCVGGGAQECSIVCIPLRMAMLPKWIEWGKNVRERKAMVRIAGSLSSFRNVALLSANRVNETCNLISSGGRRQALMVNAIHGLTYGKRLPT